MTTEEWIKKHFKETWKEVKTDIDFSKYEPIKTNSSLHVHEERYKIDGRTYRLLYPIDNTEPLIEVLL
jgi:mRNA-degrading endonuclease RelE of RelBE toxin-antitoxin system